MEKVNKIKQCAFCGKDFDRGRHPIKKTCSKECCDKLILSTKDERARKASEKAVKVNKIKQCVLCGKDFNRGKHPDKKTCSKECCDQHKINTKDDRIRKSYEAIQLKYGVDHPSKIEGFYDKVRKTKLEKYGDENYTNREQAIETNIERYGVDNAMKLEETREKGKKTKKEKYGDENYNNREQAIETSIEKYGVEHHFKNPDIMKEFHDKFEKEHGVRNPLLLDESKQKAKESVIENYGTEFYFSSNEHLMNQIEKKKKTLLPLLDSQNLSFDFEQYEKIRTRNSDGTRTNIRYDVKCNTCGKEFDVCFNNQNSAIICRSCFPVSSNSSTQIKIRTILKENNIDFIENTKKIIKPFELDFYLPEYNLALEVNGNYWHSELGGGKNKMYHLRKSEFCKEKGIKLIHIFEDEIEMKFDIINSIVLNLLSLTKNNINAENTVIKEVDFETSKEFNNNNHIQGNVIGSVNYGLYYQDELIYTMNFSKKTKEKGIWELLRCCNKLNYNVIDGFEKTLNYFVENYNPSEIITFADCRWEGLSYENTIQLKNNFEYVIHTSPSYFYTNKVYINRINRFYLNKKIMMDENKEFTKEQTEWEMAQILGYDRIWDCGSMKFVKKYK